MKLKTMRSYSKLSKESLKKITAGTNQTHGRPPDCDTIPIEYRKLMGCGEEFAPPDC